MARIGTPRPRIGAATIALCLLIGLGLMTGCNSGSKSDRAPEEGSGGNGSAAPTSQRKSWAGKTRPPTSPAG